MMRYGTLLFYALLLLAGCASKDGTGIRDVAALRSAPLYTFNEYELDSYLRDQAAQPLSVTQRVERIARQNLKQPYRLYLLGEYPYELYDPDPMYCLSASDCVTFVEQTYAMALADDWTSFFRTLQRIRYRDGRVGIVTRNHFTEADWNINNAWLFDDVTNSLGEGDDVKPLHESIDRSAFFAKYNIHANLPVQQFEGTYLSKAGVPHMLAQLRTGDVLEIVKGTDKSQYVSHLGLIVVDGGTSVKFIHSGKPCVQEMLLTEYVEKHSDILGVKVLRLAEKPLPKDRIKRASLRMPDSL